MSWAVSCTGAAAVFEAAVFEAAGFEAAVMTLAGPRAAMFAGRASWLRSASPGRPVSTV
ncbi:hypothetical protein SCE1572_42455 [Sorangium cellulosum So0157-2]|uniref:Uncharacterized protein n=1 Tax=Sorangium cellulosum So0157-2 TaxID=1254432 RepID=S4Y8L5_SORCE|nr:hypothetical protein SCE1572_42455 [Sorangium cellulosum So0157-2]